MRPSSLAQTATTSRLFATNQRPNNSREPTAIPLPGPSVAELRCLDDVVGVSMRFRTLVVLTPLLFVVSTAVAGAWGAGSFENDDALDWVWELEASTGSSVLVEALESVADEESYIEAPSGSYAVAAAEVLAALAGKPSEALPPGVVAWTKNHAFKPSSELLETARLALANVMDENRSELAQLWSESEDFYQEWKSHLTDLSGRLE